jgi:hypothetical protein
MNINNLIEVQRQADVLCVNTKDCKDCVGYGKGGECKHYLVADELHKSGCVMLPCKVGDTVYRVIGDKRVKKPHKCKVIGFWLSAEESYNSVHLVRYVNDVLDYSVSLPLSEFGKSLFLSEDEALEEMNKLRSNEV